MAQDSSTRLAEESRFNRLRADMWRMACDMTLRTKELIQGILNLVGPELTVSRACYNECKQRKAVCAMEWRDVGVKSSIGSGIPRAIIDLLTSDGPFEFSRENVKVKIPRALRPVAMPVIGGFIKALNLQSVFTVPFHVDGQLEMLITFDICANKKRAPTWTTARKRLAVDVMLVISQGLELRRVQHDQRKAKREVQKQVREQASELDSVSDELDKQTRQRERTTAKLEASLKEKDVLLMEIQHRVKNNLQIVDSLMNLQSGYVKNEQTRAILQDTRNRVRSMALIHEKLYQTRNLARIDLRDYLQSLVTYLFRSYGVTAEGVAMRLDVQLVRLDPNPAILCGLIVNELVSNSLKHAFPAGRSGWIAVRFRRVKRSKYVLTVSDNGVGLGAKAAAGKSKSLGLEMVGMLTEQLGATLKVSRRRGTEYRVSFDTRR